MADPPARYEELAKRQATLWDLLLATGARRFVRIALRCSGLTAGANILASRRSAHHARLAAHRGCAPASARSSREIRSRKNSQTLLESDELHLFEATRGSTTSVIPGRLLYLKLNKHSHRVSFDCRFLTTSGPGTIQLFTCCG